MSPSSTHDDIRKLEMELEESLLALDYAQQQQEPVFAPAAVVAELQLRLDQLRGTVDADPQRRAAWLAHLAKSPECQIVHDGPTSAGDVAARRTVSPVRPMDGARVEFPVIDWRMCEANE